MSGKRREPDTNELLWEIGRHAPDEAEGSISSDELDAYRAGELSPEQAERFERALADDPRARRRAIESTCGVPPAPVATNVSGSARSWRSGLLVAGGAIAAGIALILLLVPPRDVVPQAAGDGAALELSRATHRVTVRGASRSRSAPAVPQDQGPAVAYPDTTLRVQAQAEGAVPDTLLYALYVARGNEIERLPIESEMGQGVAAWRVPAIALSNGSPGTYELFVVIAEEALPADVLPRPVDGGRPSEFAWYRRVVELLPSTAEATGDNR